MPTADWIKHRPIAHRGYHDLNDQVWENTLSAFGRAADHGFAIECDLQMSKDGTPVVFHDYVLDRLCGRQGDVRETPTEQLEELAVGSTDDTIPSLTRMLDHINGRCGLVIELKSQPAEDTEPFARAVLDALSGYRGQVALMSFDHAVLHALTAMHSPYPVGLTAHESKDEIVIKNWQALEMPLDFVSFHVTDLPSPFVERVRAIGLPVITWTVRDRDTIELTKKHADQMTFEGFDPDDLQL